jgi:uncharacterized protein YecE (DUF72 family)
MEADATSALLRVTLDIIGSVPITPRSGIRKAYVGTAAWTNPPTERASRASNRSHLEHYATQFNAVEINSSFYRSHELATYRRWRDSTPADFRFSVKAPRTVTHERALRNCHAELQQFLQEVAGLGKKLRVVLVQTPASLPFEGRLAARFFGELKRAGSFQIACEPRHPSWFSPDAEATLRRVGVARVAADPPKTPEAREPAGAPRLAYYRLHGHPRMYYSTYSAEFLTELATRVSHASSQTRDVWCIFDNTARHASWENAQHLRNLLSGASDSSSS